MVLAKRHGKDDIRHREVFSMKRILAIATLCLAALAAADTARAITVVAPGFAISVPLYATVAPPPPVYVAPAYVPPPVYVGPAYAPPPVYVGPAYVPPPVWGAPRAYRPRPVAVGPYVGPRPVLPPPPMMGPRLR